jgi:hypothetical protein
MKPRVIHQQAMNFSFKAKEALEQGSHSEAFEFYVEAAKLESQVADFYLDKPELEPTRSVVIRSAAFLNLKAGMLENAKRFIFFGLLNIEDKFIKAQLNNALEVAVSLGNLSGEFASDEFNYFNLMRQRSIHYILEPSTPIFGKSVGLDMIKEFSENYLQSIKAYAISKLKNLGEFKTDIQKSILKEVDKLVNPVVTSAAYGSFKFSIANDFLSRDGEEREVLELKSNVIAKYHYEIFINPLTDADIDSIKNQFDEEDINDIFRPLAKIKANNSKYVVGYYASEDFEKKYLSRIVNKQRNKLLTIKNITQEDIGELESSIVHRSSSRDGKVHSTTIHKEKLKAFEFDHKTNQIEPSNHNPLILNEEILLAVLFNSDDGFTISFDDFGVQYRDTRFDKTLKGFYDLFYFKVKNLVNTSDKIDQDLKDWEVIKKLLQNPEALKD